MNGDAAKKHNDTAVMECDDHDSDNNESEPLESAKSTHSSLTVSEIVQGLGM